MKSSFPALARAPINTKYAHIAAKTNSNNVVKPISVKSDNLIAKKRAELFERVTPNQLESLVDSGLTLIDLRDPDSFAVERVRGASSYPLKKVLSDHITTEFHMLKYKKIYAYHENEKLTAQGVTTLIQKGWNCVVVSGGFEEVKKRASKLVETGNQLIGS